jgi:hypothetical protein
MEENFDIPQLGFSGTAASLLDKNQFGGHILSIMSS